MQKINFSDLYPGMNVQDGQGNIGVVKEIQDEHNVFVEYANGEGSAIHCLVEGCTEIVEANDVEYIVPQYDPLYYTEPYKCQDCGNTEHFEIWIEEEYDDGSDEPNTCNKLVEVRYVRCENCGEML